MKCELMDVTPTLAREWLKKNTHNRPLNELHIRRIGAAIRHDEWVVNGDTIKFNCDDTLIDGQKRLHAIVRSGRTVPSWVVWGVPEEAFDVIDQLQPRSLADALHCHGEKYCISLAGAIKHIYALDERVVQDSGGLRIPVGVSILEDNPELRRSVKRIYVLVQGRLVPVAVAVALHYLMWQRRKSLADSFWDGVLVGENLIKGTPALTLRNFLINNRSKPKDERYTSLYIQAVCIKAWNAARVNRQCNRLIWPANEEFPSIL